MNWAARSPTITTGAAVLPEGTVGIIDASATLRPDTINKNLRHPLILKL